MAVRANALHIGYLIGDKGFVFVTLKFLLIMLLLSSEVRNGFFGA